MVLRWDHITMASILHKDYYFYADMKYGQNSGYSHNYPTVFNMNNSTCRIYGHGHDIYFCLGGILSLANPISFGFVQPHWTNCQPPKKQCLFSRLMILGCTHWLRPSYLTLSFSVWTKFKYLTIYWISYLSCFSASPSVLVVDPSKCWDIMISSSFRITMVNVRIYWVIIAFYLNVLPKILLDTYPQNLEFQ